MTRRRRGIICFAAISLSLSALFFYMTRIEPYWLKVDVQTIPLPQWKSNRPLTILHLSDFHVSISANTLDRVADAITRGLAWHPDLICITGDFVTGNGQDGAAYTRQLIRLGAAAPTFAGFGNHDGGPWTKFCGGHTDHTLISRWLTQAGIVPLLNASREITLHGQKVRIIGLGDAWNQELRPQGLFQPGSDALSLVLIHNPDVKHCLPPYGWDLMLAGHLHGGQMYIPGIGYPFAPAKDKNFILGLHRWQDRYIYISSGVGNLHGMRLNSRPQIGIIKIVAAKK